MLRSPASPPREGDVAALIDNESTLKTYLTERGKPFLRAENPKYPKMFSGQRVDDSGRDGRLDSHTEITVITPSSIQNRSVRRNQQWLGDSVTLSGFPRSCAHTHLKRAVLAM
jgi:hypothetical protein